MKLNNSTTTFHNKFNLLSSDENVLDSRKLFENSYPVLEDSNTFLKPDTKLDSNIWLESSNKILKPDTILDSNIGLEDTNVDLSITSIGFQSGHLDPQQETVSIGTNAGFNQQGFASTAIGAYSGHILQQPNTVAIGHGAGFDTQSIGAIAIGKTAGYNYQQNYGVAIGYEAGYESQQNQSVAIGASSGHTNQQSNSVAIGTLAGNIQQGEKAVAIGCMAGHTNQASNSICIGTFAGQEKTNSNSIILNASNTVVNSPTEGLFIKPIRSDKDELDLETTLCYDINTGEIKHNKPTLVSADGNNVNIRSTKTGQSITNYIRVKMGSSYIWIPFLDTDPS